MADNAVHGAVRAATGSRPFELAARAGYSISGVLHLLIAYIIVRLDRRELVWINVTPHPTAEWVAR